MGWREHFEWVTNVGYAAPGWSLYVVYVHRVVRDWGKNKGERLSKSSKVKGNTPRIHGYTKVHQVRT